MGLRGTLARSYIEYLVVVACELSASGGRCAIFFAAKRKCALIKLAPNLLALPYFNRRASRIDATSNLSHTSTKYNSLLTIYSIRSHYTLH